MKKRLKEMEDEAAALREMQAKVEKEMGSVQEPSTAAATQANREEVDSRSVFVGNLCMVPDAFSDFIDKDSYLILAMFEPYQFCMVSLRLLTFPVTSLVKVSEITVNLGIVFALVAVRMASVKFSDSLLVGLEPPLYRIGL
ncbi:hypothetical protein TIFTF001_028022 [Ficus carica]|uniref:Uncharacterized protein n=1 Tax=Ficus carica TaxID=3494 RepID=A0AA88IZI1_FICCA|nr:hypothetical protein TIFTF001_028022 [Ficus carica]